MKQVITQTDNDSWRGMCLLTLYSFPSQLMNPESLLSEILDMLTRLAISAEMLVIKDGNLDSLRCFLILRWRGVSRKETGYRISQESGMFLKKLELSGIRATAAETIDEIDACIDLIRSAAEKKCGNACISFFPAERIFQGPTGLAYFPGCWAAGIGQDCAVQRMEANARAILSWTELLNLLSSYSCFCFSVQIQPTVLSREEKTLIAGNVEWIKRTTIGGEKDRPNRFSILQSQEDSRLFTLNLFLAGTAEMIRYLALTAENKGLRTITVPPLFFRRPGYMIYGDRQMSEFMDCQGHDSRYRDEMLASGLRRLNRIVTTREIQAFLPLPAEPGQINDLNIQRETSRSGPLPESMRSRKDSILIGDQKQPNREVYYPMNSLSRHGCIVGKPGSGKTTFSLGLLYQVRKLGIPFLVIEPAKREYRSLFTAIPELQVWTPGNNSVSPLEMNLFLPPPGVTLEEYLPCVDQIFDMAFSMTSLLKDVFTKVIRRCYNLYGWRDESTRDAPEVQAFGLHEFIREFRHYIRETVYDAESRNNVENSGVLRLQKLLEANPVMFDTNRSPDYEKMLSAPTVIELDAISDPVQKTLVMAVLIVNVMAAIRKRTDFSGRLRNLILIDEAHVLLSPGDSRRDSDASDPGGAGLRMLQEMTLIMRAYGTALFFGDQSPAKLTKEIFGNVDLKIMFRLDDSTDRQMLAGTTLLTGDMINHMVKLHPGEGYMSCCLLEEPVLLQTPDTEKILSLQKNVPDHVLQSGRLPEAGPPFSQCSRCPDCKVTCDISVRKEARFLARLLMMESRELKNLLLSDPEKARKAQINLPGYLQDRFLPEAEQLAAKKGSQWNNRLAGCLKIQITRELLINGNCTLTECQLWGEEPIETPAEDTHSDDLMNLLSFRGDSSQ